MAGYKVYYGPASGNAHPHRRWECPTYTVPGLVEGSTYHFAVTAYNASLTESGFSDDVRCSGDDRGAGGWCWQSDLGCRVVTVNFSNTSTGTHHQLRLEFRRRWHQYRRGAEPRLCGGGDHTVSLTVTGPGAPHHTRSNYVTVTTATPMAQFTGSPTSGVGPLTVNPGAPRPEPSSATPGISATVAQYRRGAEPRLCSDRDLHGEPDGDRSGGQQHRTHQLCGVTTTPAVLARVGMPADVHAASGTFSN